MLIIGWLDKVCFAFAAATITKMPGCYVDNVVVISGVMRTKMWSIIFILDCDAVG